MQNVSDSLKESIVTLCPGEFCFLAGGNMLHAVWLSVASPKNLSHACPF